MRKFGGGYIGRVDYPWCKKTRQNMGNILERVVFSLTIRLSLSTFLTGGVTVKVGCEFSRYILISIVLVSYSIDKII